MVRHRIGALIAGVFAMILAACSSSNSSGSVAPAAPTNISGDYSGSVTDSVAGQANATATLAQTGYDAGGAVTLTPASGTLTGQLSLTLSASNAVAGAMVIDYPNNGPTCSFSVTGSYSTSTNVLTGSYTAVTNCSGQSGTFSLTQQCTDTIASHIRRERVGGTSPC
jgi:hypothetical protein